MSSAAPRHAAALCLLALAGPVACSPTNTPHPGAYQGVVELDERVLGAAVTGRLVRLDVDRGDAVKQDQIIAEIDHAVDDASRVARAAEADAARAQLDLLVAGTRREDLDNMAAQIRAARANQKLLEVELERARRLVSSQAAPQATVDQYAGEVDRARAEREALEERYAALRHGARPEEIAATRAKLAAADAAVALADRVLDHSHVRSPIAGTVQDVAHRVGEILTPGSPIVTVADPAHPYVDVFVPEGDVTGLAVGGAATAEVDGRGSWTGAIEHIASATEFTPKFVFSERERPNLVVRVRVRLADPSRTLHAGLPAFVTLARGPAR